MARKPLVTGSIDIQILLSFLLGVILVATMLVFAVLFPNPSPTTQWIFIVVLSLAAAGVGAVIPGILKINIPYIEAGGALALFLLVFLFKPAIVQGVGNFKTPPVPPHPVIEKYLSLVDANSLDDAWESLDAASRAGVASDRAQYKRLYENARTPLGTPVSRTEQGAQQFESPQGYPAGIYRVVTYRTKFNNDRCRMENVTVRATNEIEWKVYEHNISPLAVECS